MTRRSQREQTVFQQGFADGRQGRPFRYNKPTKRRRGWDGRPAKYSYLYWYYTKYQTGYRLGQESRRTYWLQRAQIPRWLAKCLIGTLGAFLTVAFSTLL